MADRYVLELEGLMLEKLLNLALGEGAAFARIIRLTRQRVSVTAAPADARLLINLAGKYHVGCHIVCKTGLCALVERIRSRLTLAAAFAVMAAICLFYLGRLWSIDVRLIRGETVPAEAAAMLNELDGMLGTPWRSIDTGAAAMRLAAAEGCSYASVRRQGVAMIIEIACEESPPSLYDMDASRDLVALCDGVISAVNVKNGTAMVSPGDTVKKGQVLISGYERAGKEDFSELGALGSVKARIWQEGEASLPYFNIEKRFTGRKSVDMDIVTPWLRVALIRGEDYESCDTEYVRENIGGLFIPLYIEKTVHTEYETVYAAQDMETAKSTLEAESYAAARAKAAENAPENAEIIDKWTDFSMIESEDIIYARTVLELEAEIAVTRGYLEDNRIE